jgi:hypothetical protein
MLFYTHFIEVPLCVRDMDFVFFNDVSNGIWNCWESVIMFVFPLVLTIMSDASFHRHGGVIQVQEQNDDREHNEVT